MIYYIQINLNNFIVLMFCFSFANVSSCSSNESLVKYYSNYSGGINYTYDYIETFKGLLYTKDLGNYFSYYKVYFSEDSKPLKAEGFDKKGNLLAVLKFDPKGRQIQSERKNQSCKYIYDDIKKTKETECFNKDGTVEFMYKGFYKNNLKYRTDVYKGQRQIDYYIKYDYTNNIRNVYHSNGDLKESVPLELPPEK